MADFIEPKVLKGFRDFLPPAEIARRALLEQIEGHFRSYGFVPIDTPALEYTEVLLGKGGGETEKQIYRFNDNGGRDVALRFDLTVPFARFLAEHRAELTFPFKRYHIAKVWRGENTQRGRYREFTQCDMDIVGSDSAAADFEILHIMAKTLPAISGSEVIIRLNHRGLFNTFLSKLGVLDQSVNILRTVDKLTKIGRDETAELLAQFVGESNAGKILTYIEIKGNFSDTLAAMTDAAGTCPEAERLGLIQKFISDSGIAENSVALDPSITRGLDYYTGVVFESFLADMPSIGSICSGGRYDNLVALYSTDKRSPLKGVGTSIGIDRLIAGLESLGRLHTVQSYAAVAVACVSESSAGACQNIAETLRKQGIPCEVFLDAGKLAAQFQMAEKKGLRWVIIPSAENPLTSPLTLRNLATRENRENLSLEAVLAALKQA